MTAVYSLFTSMVNAGGPEGAGVEMTVPGAVDGAGAAVAETAVGRLVTDELESGSSLSQATNANTTGTLLVRFTFPWVKGHLHN
jgi:hypothetical protein